MDFLFGEDVVSGGYRFLPHTADIKVEAWGDTLEEAFKYAGIAFTDIIVDVKKVSQTIVKEIKVEGYDLEELLYNYIEKLILYVDLDNLVFSDFTIQIDKKEEYHLKGEGYGEHIDIAKQGFKVHVKAMTYHEMEIKETEGKIIIRYVVDI